MVITILGYEDKSYPKKSTGEYVEALELYYSKENKKDGAVGSCCGSEFVSAKAFPKEFNAIKKAGLSIVGTRASISRDVRTFGDRQQAQLVELELLD